MEFGGVNEFNQIRAIESESYRKIWIQAANARLHQTTGQFLHRLHRCELLENHDFGRLWRIQYAFRKFNLYDCSWDNKRKIRMYGVIRDSGNKLHHIQTEILLCGISQYALHCNNFNSKGRLQLGNQLAINCWHLQNINLNIVLHKLLHSCCAPSLQGSFHLSVWPEV
jgi:hypothetical protein